MVNMKVFRLYLLRFPGSLRDCLPTGSLSSVGCVPHHPSSGYWLAAWSCSWVQEQLPMLLFPEIHLIHPIHSLIEGWYLHLPGIGKSSLYSGLTGEPERGGDWVFLPGEKNVLSFEFLFSSLYFQLFQVKKCFEFACEANFRKSTIPEYKREYEDIENRCLERRANDPLAYKCLFLSWKFYDIL